MKVFWMLLVVLLVAAGVVAALLARPRVIEVTERVVTIDATPASIARPKLSEVAATDPPASPTPPESKRAIAVDAQPSTPIAPAAPTIDQVLGTKPESKPEPSHSATNKPEPKPAGSGASNSTSVAKASDGEVVAIAENPKFPDAKLVKAKVLRKADGSLLIDDRYRVTGNGTEKDPYKLPWDMMISTKDSFNPQLGLARMPQRVVMFDGKHVKITGFTAFPLSAQSPKEMLVMLNQWDGCCIGVPPTAYDAIEVRLAKPGTPEDKLNTHGSVTGVFQVDPYETNGWLMGLYLMNDAHAEYDE